MLRKKQCFVITDLGPGDGGKGGVVHAVADRKKAHTVLKIGGGQGSHGVCTSRGERFNFSHFGCGTFEGVRTHITHNMVIDPLGLMLEGNTLRYEHGVHNPFDLLTVGEEALCVTPYHRIASRIRELARKDRPKGTIGTGIGEAALDTERYPHLSIRVKDLNDPYLENRLESLAIRKRYELAPAIDNISYFWESDQTKVRELADDLYNERMPKAIAEALRKFREIVRVVDRDHLRTIFAQDGTVVVETSHGVLTDRYYGFHPTTSRLRSVPGITVFPILEECGYDGEVLMLGVTRAYQIRHGAGPMVTEVPGMADKMLPGSHKDENRWQGKVRIGPLDFVSLRYAVNVCGGPKAFAGIAVTWFDQIPKWGAWQVCDKYHNATDLELFTEEGDILVHRIGQNIVHQLAHQRALSGVLIEECTPEVTSYDVPPTKESAIALCRRVFDEKLGVPVRMISFGPTENDKVFI